MPEFLFVSSAFKTQKKGKFPFFSFSYGCTPGNKTEFLASQNLTEEEFQEHPTINWDAILWVRRPLELWVVQVILAIVSLTEALLLAYLGYKVRILSFPGNLISRIILDYGTCGRSSEISRFSIVAQRRTNFKLDSTFLILVLYFNVIRYFKENS